MLLSKATTTQHKHEFSLGGGNLSQCNSMLHVQLAVGAAGIAVRKSSWFRSRRPQYSKTVSREIRKKCRAPAEQLPRVCRSVELEGLDLLIPLTVKAEQ